MTRSSYLLLINIVTTTVIKAVPFGEYAQPSDCSDIQFYDISHLKCEKCPGENTAPAADSKLSEIFSATAITRPASFAELSCSCKEGYRKVIDYGGIDTKCEACPVGQVPTPDGWGCAGCIRPLYRNETARQLQTCPNTCDFGGRVASISCMYGRFL